MKGGLVEGCAGSETISTKTESLSIFGCCSIGLAEIGEAETLEEGQDKRVGGRKGKGKRKGK